MTSGEVACVGWLRGRECEDNLTYDYDARYQLSLGRYFDLLFVYPSSVMITVTNPDDDDAIYSLDCDTGITLADLKALLEADVSSASEGCIAANDC